MKVSLERAFPIPAPAERAWALLQDIERVAGCMPGARITERIDERHFKGTVAVRFGPANLSFRGQLEVAAIDPATRTLRLTGKGSDTGGGSGASLDLSARVDAVEAISCSLVGHSELSISGRAATFGARMADAVAEQVLRQFAANFSAELQSQPAAAAAAATPATAAANLAEGAKPVSALNGFALLRALLRSWLQALFGWRGA